MKRAKGFTLIELMIVAAILGILAAVILGPRPKRMNDGSVCLGGYVFVGGQQIIGSNGGGVPCNEGSAQ